MRPIRLSMQAFGSYGKQTVIDFEAADQNLFLITGDTGAGKSTIFDAIVFALYGEASSGANKKDGTELQSQFAGYDVQPFVELTFLEGTGEARQEYTVRRVPRHFRPLKRGKGTREESETVSLIMPDGTEYPQKETDKKLEEIVGLTKSQFMQVAMIAQGEFMELLRARSDDKKVIFRKLFHTELYQKIIDELGRRRKETQQEMGQIRTACQTETAHLLIPEDFREDEALKKVWEHMKELKARILGAEKLSVVDMEQLMELLGQLTHKLKERESQAEWEYGRANEDYLARRDGYNHAIQLLSRFEEMEQAEKALEACADDKERMDETARLIRRIRAAWEIRELYDRYEDAQKAVNDKKSELLKQQEALPGLSQTYETAAKAADEQNQRFNRELEAYSKVAEQVDKALEVFKQLKAAGQKVAASEKAYAKARKAFEDAQKKSGELEAKEQAWRAQCEALKDAGVLYARWQGRAEKYREIVKDTGDYEKLEEDFSRQKELSEQALVKYSGASAAYEKKNGEYESARRIFLNMQAGFIAREQLRPGMPCPVCGSLDHPDPCQIREEHRELTREALEDLEKDVGQLRLEQEKAASQAQAAAAILKEKENSVRAEGRKLYEKLGENLANVPDMSEDFSAQQAKELLHSWRKDLARERDVLKKDADTYNQLQASIRDLDDEKVKIKEQALQAQTAAADAQAQLAGHKAALESLEASREYASENEAKQALTMAGDKKTAAKTRLDQDRAAEQSAKSRMETARTLIRRYQQELPAQELECGRRKAAYELLMGEKEMTLAEWEPLTRNNPKNSVDTLQKQVDEYNKKKTWAKSRYDQAKEAIGQQQRPEPEALKAAMDQAELKMNKTRADFEKVRSLQETNDRVYQALAPKMEERSKIMARHRCLDELYNRLGGKVSGARMDLETFVQRYYLERILYAANRRFQEMSAGQFELRMRDADMAGVGKNRGLDLMVYSTVTGKEREVRTLSGGESFMAALSLALGMADQIQESAASVNLDVMFIDEGFGSLDDNSRDKAVRVLQEMAGGSKLIGIISHVTELKQEIEDQLIVKKDEEGSHVRWQIS